VIVARESTAVPASMLAVPAVRFVMSASLALRAVTVALPPSIATLPMSASCRERLVPVAPAKVREDVMSASKTLK